MRVYAFALLVLICSVLSCKKTVPQEIVCPYQYSYADVMIGFTGFSLEDLDTIVVYNYAPNTGFSRILRHDSIIRSNLTQNVMLSHDTAFMSYMNHQAAFCAHLRTDSDYIISIPATGSNCSVSKGGFLPLPEYYTSATGCTGGIFNVFPDTAYINGQVHYRSKKQDNIYVLYFMQK
jgi:hypothetical protein